MEALVAEIYAIVQDILRRHQGTKPVPGDVFGLSPEPALSHQLSIKFEGRDEIKLGISRDAGRPPLEWLAEITLFVGTPDDYRHYLIREGNELVHALGKVITDVDEAEAARLLQTLRNLRDQLESGGALQADGADSFAD